MVTEFIDGYNINDIENLKKDKFSLADLNRKLFEAFGYQIFQSGFVHADPHPGNGERFIYIIIIFTLLKNKLKLLLKIYYHNIMKISNKYKDSAS